MTDASGTQNGHNPRSDVFDRVDGTHDDLFAHIDLDVALKDDLYDLIGDAIKAGMRLRERYPVRLTAPRDGEASERTFVDAYLAEAGDVIETYFERIAGRVATFVNDEML